MKKLIAAATLIAGFFSSAKADDFNLPSINTDEIIQQARTGDKSIFNFSSGKPQAQTTKEWTVLVFMNAKNNLADGQLFGLVGKWADKDMDEMKKVGTTDKVNVLVEYGKKGEGAKRVMILKKSGIGGIFSSGEKVFLQDPKADMGDYKRVVNFVKWAKVNYPAKKYMLIIWNHGLGWIDPNMQQDTAGAGTSNKGISFDDETKNYIRTRQLGEILKQTGYVDVFAMNACLMQMAEVTYEMKDYAGLIVGSEETMLAQGFDYEKLLNFINANTTFTNEQLSSFFMSWYKQFFAEGMNVGPLHMPLDNVASTLSTLNPGAFKDLPQYLNYLADTAMKNDETQAVKTAVANVIRFTSVADPEKDKKKLLAPYVDLYDFARIISANAKNHETKQAAEYLMGFIKGKLVLSSVGINKDAENGYDYSTVGGVSINMTMKMKPVPPQFDDILETKYQDLTLSKDSRWDEFVAWSSEVWAK